MPRAFCCQAHNMFALLRFRDQWVDGLYEWEAMKIRVAGPDAADTMLSHENRRLGVVHEVARQQRHLAQYLSQYATVPMRGRKHAEPRRLLESRQEP